MFSASYAAVKNILQQFIAIGSPVKKVNIDPPVQTAMSENLIIEKNKACTSPERMA